MGNLGPYELNTIVTGDARELAKVIPDESVDLIFTDPPYLKEFVPLYGWLAETAARILKPGGFCVCYTGGTWLPDIIISMAEHLTWHFFCGLPSNGPAAMIWDRQMLAREKLVLMWTKGKGRLAVSTMSNIIAGDSIDKRYHKWGQGVGAAHYVLSYILGDTFSANEGKIVFDPFAGGGTTCEAAQTLGAEYLAFEIDNNSAEIARNRMARRFMTGMDGLPLFEDTRQD